MLPWFFLLDRQNYGRWLTVHWVDLEEIESTAPDVYHEFVKGKFTCDKLGRRFSRIGIDHHHEQNNKSLKSAGGAIGLTHDPSSLRRFTIAGPEISRLLTEFCQEDEGDDDDQLRVSPHHEESESFQIRYLDKCSAMKDSFLEGENPFMVSGEMLIAIDSRFVMEDAAVTALFNAESHGIAMLTEFVKERLVDGTKTVYDTMTKSQIAIYTSKKRDAKDSPLKAMRANSQCFSRMFIISTAIDEFFEYENEHFPPSISINGLIRSGQKAPLVKVLERKLTDEQKNQQPPSCDSIVFDGAVLVHTVKPTSTIKYFEEYVAQLADYVRNTVSKARTQRTDLVWDMYSNKSLKGVTRNRRGLGIRRHDLPTKGKLPSDWADYLRNDENKQELFLFLSQSLLEVLSEYNVITNVCEQIKCSMLSGTSLLGLDLNGLEEADGRIILHTKDAVHNGAKKVLVRSSDTDVLVLAISFFPSLRDSGLQELWLIFGSGKNRRYIAAHAIAGCLGDRKAVALRGFHAFTGNDQVSFFATKGKISCFSAWQDEDTEAFLQLSHPLDGEPEDHLITALERYTARLYGIKDEKYMSVNAARKKYLFTTQNRAVHAIPPCRSVFIPRTKRAAYVGGHIWGRAADGSKPPSPESWGWYLQEGKWNPVWSTESLIWSKCRTMEKCGCGSNCETQRCKCRRYLLCCTPLCTKCKGDCSNKTVQFEPTELDRITQEETEEDIDGDLMEMEPST